MKNEELDQIIEKSFGTEPGFQLPADFAQKVAFSVVRRQQWKADLREYFYLLAVVVSLLAVVFGFYYFVDKELITRLFSWLSENIIQVVFAAFVLNFVFFADRVLLRLLFNRWNRT